MATQAEVSTSTPGGVSIEREYAGVKISLENSLFPSEAFAETPSQKDGLRKAAEDELRRIGCEFIQVAGIMLKVPQVAMASAQVLFQRFFFAKSFIRHNMEEIAMACIWLASKVEECPRRVRDVINVFHYLRLKRNKMLISPMVLDQEYVTLKNNVIKAERRVLKELGFCVHVKHPHKIIVVYLQVLEMEKNRELVQTAWNYMNDSLQTTVFVQYSPETIACACIYLAARVLQIPVPNRPPWFYLFNATEEDLKKICVTLLCVYQTVKTPYEELEKMVNSCREVLQQEKMKAKGLTTTNDDINRNSANSPASKPPSPTFDLPQNDEKRKTAHRSSTVSASQDKEVAANGSSKSKQDENRRSPDSRVKRSRTRSASSIRVKKYRRQSSDSSSSEHSPSEHKDDRRPSRSKDVLPKSYSQQNSNRYPDDRRHRRQKHNGKSRHSKHHRRDDSFGNKSRDSSRAKRLDETIKKHKRKHTADAYPIAKSSRVNGEKVSSTSPSKKQKHNRSRKDSHKKKPRRSESPVRVSKR